MDERCKIIANIHYNFRHWNEFYQFADLLKLTTAGISHIRIPYGYWLVDVEPGEPFPAPPSSDSEGQRFYLKRMLQWAEQAGLKVKIAII